MAYRLKDYLYNDKLTKEQNILMDRLYKLRMSGMAEAFEKQLLEPNTGLEPFEVRFAAIVNQEWDQLLWSSFFVTFVAKKFIGLLLG